ncbi:transporter subunit: ATP-binding component of ABC superfamily [Candidatus Desulfarcum epimagneticum]|uniref:Cell division ATP-binding protein FtsE n=1 Tax=uncultured Desulfobacteraceae bacterium TaxID=218296 RepID=A0A484HDK2_9BACT|nr:transporter subunit: ATP-binding component of ABC superfamily [uncultured Desulfobacteraceae bacterium]
MKTEPRHEPKHEKEAAIRFFHVRKKFGARTVLNDITLDIFKNEFVFVTGPSGAGKTTLLSLIYLKERATEGEILVDGLNLSRIRRKRAPDLRRKLGIIFQDYKLIPTKTAFENVSLVLEAAGVKKKLIQKKVNSILRSIRMEEKSRAYPPSLSGGEQQRVAFARAVAGDPEIIIADEPFGSLDPDSAASILKLLDVYHARGATIILATHDRDLIQKRPGRVIRLSDGSIHLEGERVHAPGEGEA